MVLLHNWFRCTRWTGVYGYDAVQLTEEWFCCTRWTGHNWLLCCSCGPALTWGAMVPALTIYRRRQTSPPDTEQLTPYLAVFIAGRGPKSAKLTQKGALTSTSLSHLPFVSKPPVPPKCNQTHLLSVQSISPAAHSHHISLIKKQHVKRQLCTCWLAFLRRS